MMFSIATGRPLTDVLRLCWTARRPELLRGGTGIGKSAVLSAFAAETGVGYNCRDLSLMEPVDLVGMPQLGDGVTRFFPPAFLPTEGKGLLVLEEINRAPQYMRAPCLQLLTDRTLNDYRLPDGWLPVAAVNPAEDGYEVADLDPALLSRFVQIDVVADRDAWLPWARMNGVHSRVIAYVGSDPTVFDGPASNPRAWTYVSDLMHARDQAETPRSLLQVAIAECVGPERAVALIESLRKKVQPLTGEEVVTSYLLLRRQVKGWVKEGKLYIIKSTLLNLKKHLQPRDDFEAIRTDEASWANLRSFLLDLPGDLQEEAAKFFKSRKYEFPLKTGRAS